MKFSVVYADEKKWKRNRCRFILHLAEYFVDNCEPTMETLKLWMNNENAAVDNFQDRSSWLLINSNQQKFHSQARIDLNRSKIPSQIPINEMWTKTIGDLKFQGSTTTEIWRCVNIYSSCDMFNSCSLKQINKQINFHWSSSIFALFHKKRNKLDRMCQIHL